LYKQNKTETNEEIDKAIIENGCIPEVEVKTSNLNESNKNINAFKSEKTTKTIDLPVKKLV